MTQRKPAKQTTTPAKDPPGAGTDKTVRVRLTTPVQIDRVRHETGAILDMVPGIADGLIADGAAVPAEAEDEV